MNVLNGTYQTGNSPAATSQFTLSNTQITRVSVRTSGLQSDGKSFNPSISGDGQYVVFRSAASNLVDNDTNGQPDIFVHDRQTGLTERVNIAENRRQGKDCKKKWIQICRILWI